MKRAEDSQPDLPGMRQQEVTFEKGHKKKHLHDGIGAFVCLKFCTSARKIKPFR